MSVRAYKVLEIKTKSAPTFNLWNDTELVDWLDSINATETLCRGVGLISVSRFEIRDALKDKSLSSDTKEILRKMLEDCGDEVSVDYFCY